MYRPARGIASAGEKKGETMKRSVIALFSIILLFISTGLFLLPEDAGAADWRLVRQSTYGDASYYDAASVKRSEGQVVSFRARLGAGEYQYEMRCGKNEARMIEDGKAGKWYPLTSGSDEDLLYQAVCR